MQLQWSADISTSVLHAADALTRGLPLADDRLATALDLPARELAGSIRAAGLPEAKVWRLLLAHAWQFPNDRTLVETVLRKAVGGTPTPQVVTSLAARIGTLEGEMRRLFPKLTEELALRERPIREQWEARGPGLLSSLAHRTAPELLVEEARVVLIHPALGGGGEPHLQANAVRLEAVLANPLPQLPEFVRLGWLLGQLNCDLPAYSDLIHADRLPAIVQLALLPPILAAAEDVEATAATPALYAAAIEAWRIPERPGVDLSALLGQWWLVYQQSRPQWTVALTALDRMLG